MNLYFDVMYFYSFFMLVPALIAGYYYFEYGRVPKDEKPLSLEQLWDHSIDVTKPEVQQYWKDYFQHLNDKQKLDEAVFYSLLNGFELRKYYFDLREQQKNNVKHVTKVYAGLFGLAAIAFFYLGYINWEVCHTAPDRFSYVTNKVMDKVRENADVIKEETNQIDSAIKLVAEDFQKKYADLEKKLQTINDNIQEIDSNLVTVNDNLRKFAR